jgi:predicted DNA-binding protein
MSPNNATSSHTPEVPNGTTATVDTTNVTITPRIPRELHTRLAYASELLGLSGNQIFNAALREYIEKVENENAKEKLEEKDPD